MRIGGQKDPRYLMTQHLARFATDSGIALGVVKEEGRNLVQRMESGIATLATKDDDKHARPAILADICRIVSRKSAKGRGLLG